MHTPLQLRKNSEIINQQAKRLVKFILANPGNRMNGGNNYLDEKDLKPAGFHGIKYLTAEERVVIDHGWIFYPSLLKSERVATTEDMVRRLRDFSAVDPTARTGTGVSTSSQKP